MPVFLAAIEDAADRDKFEQIYQTYRQIMYYTANSILRDPALAEDAVQQAFMRVFAHFGQIGEVQCPQTKSFVVIIVRNIAINLYNSRKKKAVLSFDELAEWTAEMTAPNEIYAREGYARLVELIERLPEGYRSVLMLKYDNGYTTEEIARMLGLTEENVKKRLQRARKKLEQALEAEEVNTL